MSGIQVNARLVGDVVSAGNAVSFCAPQCNRLTTNLKHRIAGDFIDSVKQEVIRNGDQYAPVFDACWVAGDIHNAWGRDCLSIGDIEASLMQWTLDLAALQPAIGERGLAVGAAVVDGMEPTVDVEQRDDMSTHNATHPLARLNVAGHSDWLVYGLCHDGIITSRT